MASLLHVIGSPRGAGSSSTRLAEAFLSAYRDAHPDDTIVTRDVWVDDLPHLGEVGAKARLDVMAGQALDEPEARAVEAGRPLIAELLAADKVVVSCGMWNLTVPYRLKHWIDLVVQPGQTFGFDPSTGYFGLVTGRPLQLLLAYGGEYREGPMAPYDAMTPYLRSIFGFIGFHDQREIQQHCTALPPELSQPARDAATAEAKEAALRF